MTARLEDDYSLDQVIQTLWSAHYGKVDLLQKIAAGKVKRAAHEIENMRRDADIFKRLHAGFVKKQEAQNAAA